MADLGGRVGVDVYVLVTIACVCGARVWRAYAKGLQGRGASNSKLRKNDPEAYRAATRERRREKRAARKEVAWRVASERAAVDPGVKKKERSLHVNSDMNEHNAWDTVPWDHELEVETQREASAQPTAPTEAAAAICDQSCTMWEAFYRTNLLAYKHRRYLHAEFPELAELAERGRDDGAADSATADGAGGQRCGDGGGGGGGGGALVFEIGCGSGNAALPLLAQFPRLRVVACDVSAAAVRLLTEHPSYPSGRCLARVWDIADPRGLPPDVQPGSVDAALLVFVLSALPPDAFRRAAHNVLAALKPGGLLLFRDYGRNDEKQRKFTRAGVKLGEGWYARGNGTMVYFFDTAETDELFTSCGFEPVVSYAPTPAPAVSGGGAPAAAPAADGTARAGARFDKVLTVNRKTGDRLWRVWVTATYRKPAETAS
jgi:tRNAThr (cytosine32-N3)-methyltransferase